MPIYTILFTSWVWEKEIEIHFFATAAATESTKIIFLFGQAGEEGEGGLRAPTP